VQGGPAVRRGPLCMPGAPRYPALLRHVWETTRIVKPAARLAVDSTSTKVPAQRPLVAFVGVTNLGDPSTRWECLGRQKNCSAPCKPRVPSTTPAPASTTRPTRPTPARLRLPYWPVAVASEVSWPPGPQCPLRGPELGLGEAREHCPRPFAVSTTITTLRVLTGDVLDGGASNSSG